MKTEYCRRFVITQSELGTMLREYILKRDPTADIEDYSLTAEVRIVADPCSKVFRQYNDLVPADACLGIFLTGGIISE